jgi:hypothetical protein
MWQNLSKCPEARRGKAMIRIGLAVVALLSALAVPCFAQDRPDNADGRYTLHRTDEGYLRLDGRSGQVSLCLKRSAGWECQAVPDERAALEGEIARLQTDNANLKRELLAHHLPLPGGVKPEGAGREEERLQLPSDAELNQMMTFVEKVWKRMVEMIVTTQKDIMKKP